MNEPREIGSSLVTTWRDVETMIKRNAFPRWAGRLLGVLCVALALILGLTLYSNVQLRGYVDGKVQNECAALELLTLVPVPRPPNPVTNPSREQNYRFYVDLVYWETKDGCRR